MKWSGGFTVVNVHMYVANIKYMNACTYTSIVKESNLKFIKESAFLEFDMYYKLGSLNTS